MNNSKKILLLGASGRTGNEVLTQALDQNYRVHILVRDKKKILINHPKLKIFEGDTINPMDLRKAAEGCDTIISCLNISRKSDFPWSALRTPKDFLSKTMQNMIKVSNEHSINRLVFTSAWGVSDSKPFLPAWFRWFINNSNLSPAYLEHERQEVLIRKTALQWTIVRPVVLTNSHKQKEVKVILNNERKPALTISRKDTAKFILGTLVDDKYVGTAPVIYS